MVALGTEVFYPVSTADGGLFLESGTVVKYRDAAAIVVSKHGNCAMSILVPRDILLPIN